MKRGQSKSTSSERDAVHLKSGEPVAHSGPGLKGPTLPPTADRTSEARLTALQGDGCPGGIQPKSGRGVGRNPTAVACSDELDRESIDRLIAFFQLLDQWERNLHAEKVM